MKRIHLVPLAAIAFIAGSLLHTTTLPRAPFAAAAADVNAPLALASPREVTAAVERAQTVTLSAFTLSARGGMVRALCASARLGHRVSVMLDGAAFGGAQTMNMESIPRLQAAGVRVSVSKNPLHMKAAVLDGRDIYLSDRNWSSDESTLIIHDEDPADRQIIERAILGVASSNSHLWTRKADALRAEASIIASPHPPAIFVQSESFGAHNPVYDALATAAHHGIRVYLIVAQSEVNNDPAETDALRALSTDGVAIRIGTTTEKFALNGTNIFLGSSNATAGLPDQIDFGLVAQNNTLANVLLDHFQANWGNANAL